MRVEYVAQKDPSGCGVACLAMVTGRPYDEIRDYFVSIGKDVRDDKGGLHELDLEQYLADSGFATAKKYRWHGANVQRPTWPVPPFADAHICGVKTSGWHFVVLLRDGRVLDPNDTQPKTLSAWLEVAYIFGVWEVS